jgi:hypothetical protein
MKEIYDGDTRELSTEEFEMKLKEENKQNKLICLTIFFIVLIICLTIIICYKL